MKKQVVQYARVSLEVQTKNDAVSIDQQLAEMDALCDRNSWHVRMVFIDKENYRATQSPKRGKIVNPSGERADRPHFLAMLERVKSGEIDAIVCWRDDRLVRHPRVAVALEDVLDRGDAQRNGKDKIQVFDATGATIDRFTLSIKSAIWREENKRRAERSKMGKVGTLQDGRWPGEYRRYGYQSVKVPGKRGRVIKKDPQTAPIVHEIFSMYAAGKKIHEIRKYLIEEDASQIYTTMCKHEWSMPLISRILRSDAYLGKATWTFNDGTIFYVDIPQIIEPELWRIVQKRVERNKVLSTRNAKGVYLLQGLLKCGDCGNSMSATRLRDYTGGFSYRCHTACHNAHEGHPKPYNHNGSYVDWTVWRRIVDQIVSRPDFIQEFIQSRVKELQAEGEHVDGEITRIQRRLEGINDERVFYQRKAAQGKIPEVEFDARMDETADQIEYWQCELERLLALKNDAALVNDSLSYAKELFVKIRGQLDYLDCSPEDLEKLNKGERIKILRSRRKIIRALVDRATINSNRQITIEGILDGSEGEQFDLRGY